MTTRPAVCCFNLVHFRKYRLVKIPPAPGHSHLHRPPFPVSLSSFVSFFCCRDPQDYIPVNTLDADSLKLPPEPAAIKTLGFVANTAVPRHYYMSDTFVVVPEPGSAQCAGAISSLVAALRKLEQVVGFESMLLPSCQYFGLATNEGCRAHACASVHKTFVVCFCPSSRVSAVLLFCLAICHDAPGFLFCCVCCCACVRRPPACLPYVPVFDPFEVYSRIP